ncbi:MAG: HlyD family efflux transporter periplasmic adaptor subunit [Deltaproteobacteria bacterium]|nr:HlyD family efflux transporter periplasmic adaptor subunit [Deltaproteobacteria bacterium]
MSASIFSSSWYRVAGLVPRLRSHAEIHRVRFRGQRWYLLQDHASGRFHRFSPAAHSLIGLMNGRRSLADIWNIASERLGDDLPTQDETIRLLAQLYRANALITDAATDVEELVARDETVRRKQFWSRFRSPLAIKIPLWDPERALERMIPFVRPIFSRAGLAIWLLVVGSALTLAVQHWAALSTGVTDRVLAAENLVLLWLSFPLVKLLHEFGHAFAIKRWGGETHEMGVMFLVGVPVPYVDASASSAFASRWQRALVGAAGLFVELFVAALAMFLWLLVEPGAVRAITFNVMLIAGVSSLFFNGNPFLRFDAYYVLSDLLEIPNLGVRANQYWGYWIQRHLFGREEADNPATTRGEPLWLATYAVGALINRLMITLSIALFVASRLFFVGVLIASWSITQFAVLPIGRHLRFVLFDPRLRGSRRRALSWTFGAIGLLVVLLAFVPAPSWTRAEGVVWAREDSLVRAGTEGVVRNFDAEPGAQVELGEKLLVLIDPELTAEHEIARANLRANRAQYALDRTRDRVQAEISRQSMQYAERRLARAEEELRALVLSSPAAGKFLVEAPQDWIGRHLQRGEVVGYVVDFDPLIVRVAVPAKAVDLVRHRTERVDVRLAEQLEQVHPARIVAEVPAATDELPSLALATEGGGSIALDPSRDGEVRAFERYFLFDLAVDLSEPPLGVGGRVYVRFTHEPEPALFQFYRAARRLFLSQFNV